MKTIETTRLLLCPIAENDAPFIFSLLNSPSWIRYIGDRGIKTLDDAKKYIRDVPLKSYLQHGFGLLLVKLKSDNMPLGICGLIKRDTLKDVDIGFAFLDGHTGKGYAFESAQAVMDSAKKDFKIKKVVAIT